MTKDARDDMQARIERFDRLTKLATECKAYADDLSRRGHNAWQITLDTGAGDPTELKAAMAEFLHAQAERLRKLAELS